MTQEQFNKVCEIISELKSLESAKNEIKNNDSRGIVKPRFAYYIPALSEWFVVNQEILEPILAKYDKLIRQEIEDRINELKKEIEEI